MPTKKQLEEQIKELKLELLMTKEASEIYEKECDEWRKIDGAHGLIQDLFYDGYHTTKLCCGINTEVDEVHKAITEMKNKIDELKEENKKLKEELKAGICIGEYLAGEFKKNPH